jgi:hypothetical protein
MQVAVASVAIRGFSERRMIHQINLPCVKRYPENEVIKLFLTASFYFLSLVPLFLSFLVFDETLMNFDLPRVLSMIEVVSQDHSILEIKS